MDDDLDSFEEHSIHVTTTVSESRYKGSKGGSKSGREKKGVWDSSRSGRGGMRGGMTVEGRNVAISKTLSKLLRHHAKSAGIELDDEGFARVDKVLQYSHLKSLGVTLADIEKTVASCAKQRFTLKAALVFNSTTSLAPEPTEPSHFLIRANQGHSIVLASESLLTPITLETDNVPETVVHGTYFAHYPAIVESGGLKPMGRNHVHFATGVPGEGGVISGMRGDAELLIWVDVKRSLREGNGGIKWWLSANGVVLTEGDENGLVPTKWWKRAEARRANIGALWADGVKLKDLPVGIKGKRPPPIKGPLKKLIGQTSKPMDKDRNRGDMTSGERPRLGGVTLENDTQVGEDKWSVLG